jgi:hypothetical protein
MVEKLRNLRHRPRDRNDFRDGKGARGLSTIIDDEQFGKSNPTFMCKISGLISRHLRPGGGSWFPAERAVGKHGLADFNKLLPLPVR